MSNDLSFTLQRILETLEVQQQQIMELQQRSELVPFASFVPRGAIMGGLSMQPAQVKAAATLAQPVQLAEQEAGQVDGDQQAQQEDFIKSLEREYYASDEIANRMRAAKKECLEREEAERRRRQEEEEEMNREIEDTAFDEPEVLDTADAKVLFDSTIASINEHAALPATDKPNVSDIHYHKVWSRLSKSQVEDLYSKWVKRAAEEAGTDDMAVIDPLVKKYREEWVEKSTKIVEQEEERVREEAAKHQ